MAEISILQAHAQFTQKVVAVYNEVPKSTSFLRSFFKVKETNTKEISIMVKRGTEYVAVDVERGTNGNRNRFSKSSQKVYIPPFFNEHFDLTEMKFYDVFANATGTVDAATFKEWLDETVEQILVLQETIERAYEKQASQILETGIVTMNNGDQIDFARKAASLVANGATNTWATGTVDPLKNIEDGCKFIRQKGKYTGSVYNCILGTTALQDLLNNTIFKEKGNLRRIDLMEIKPETRNAMGGVPIGSIMAGSYKVILWSYPEYYDIKGGASDNAYINEKKIVIIPENPNFVMAFAGIPQLLTKGKSNSGLKGISGKKGAYHISEYLDDKNTTHEVHVKSAGLTIPVAVDQIYTVQVVA